MRCALSVLSVAVLAGLTVASDKDAEAELKKLEGKWEIASAEARGRKQTLKDLGMDEIVIGDGKLTFRASGKDVKSYTLTVTPGKEPKEMDWTNKGSDPHQCIYELKEGELRIAFPVLEGKAKKVTFPRPRTFNTIGKPVMVLVAKPAK